MACMARGLVFCFVPAAWLCAALFGENGLSFDVDVRSVLGPVFDDATGTSRPFLAV